MVDSIDSKGIVDPKTMSGGKKSTTLNDVPDLTQTFQAMVQKGFELREAAVTAAPVVAQMGLMDVRGWERAVAFGIEAFNANMSGEAFDRGIERLAQGLTSRAPGGPRVQN